MSRISPPNPVIMAVMTLSLFMVQVNCQSDSVDTGPSSLQKLLPAEIDSWVRGDSLQTFDRETIFDYIDGAGEVYNSYAFREVLVAPYVRDDGSSITVELFDMGDTAEAYGVFSYAREEETAGIGGGFEQRGGVLCFWQNRYFVCLAAGGGQDATALQQLARSISRQLPPSGDRPALIDLLPMDRLIPFSVRYFHVQATLNYNYYLSRDNILNLDAETNAVLARYQPGSTYCLIVEYRNKAKATNALSSFQRGYHPDAVDSVTVIIENKTFVASHSYDNFVVVILEAPTKDAAQVLSASVISKLRDWQD